MNPVGASTWTAVARSARLRDRPLPVMLNGMPLVLFRGADGAPVCLIDRCPHRSAPLSGGRVRAGAIECPYHGWRFDASGRCTLMPGLTTDLPRALVPRHATAEAGGLVFVSFDKVPGTPYPGVLTGPGVATMMLENAVESTLAEVAENILDATHTLFVHSGLLRGLGHRRQCIAVTVTGGDGWVEARYEGEARQEGLVSRLLEGERSISVGRFVRPGIVELEFWGREGPNLVTTFHLRQETPDLVRGIGVLAGPAQGGLGHLKGLLFRPFFHIGVAQDRQILAAAQRRRAQFPEIGQMLGPLDVMRPHIDAILAGRRPSVADAPARLVMEL